MRIVDYFTLRYSVQQESCWYTFAKCTGQCLARRGGSFMSKPTLTLEWGQVTIANPPSATSSTLGKLNTRQQHHRKGEAAVGFRWYKRNQDLHLHQNSDPLLSITQGFCLQDGIPEDPRSPLSSAPCPVQKDNIPGKQPFQKDSTLEWETAQKDNTLWQQTPPQSSGSCISLQNGCPDEQPLTPLTGTHCCSLWGDFSVWQSDHR